MGNLTYARVLFTMTFVLSMAFTALAQGTTSRVTGTVTDNTGAVVTGAIVTLTTSGSDRGLTAITNNSGMYLFDLIPAATYTLSVEKEGFNKFVATNNVVLINQPATINVVLEVGDVSVVVSVEGAASLVQTSSSGNVGSTIETQTLEAVPIVGSRGRNPLSLLTYQPGISTGSNTGGGVHVHGSRDRAFNFTLDGIDINESTAGGSNFTPLRTNPEALQEFQIVTSAATAELGRNSGAQVTLVTRSGTNQFNGNAFWLYQTPELHARTYASNVNNLPKHQFVQHIFGGSFGGPIVNPFGNNDRPFSLLKDKAFFFVNLQMLRAYDSAVQTRTVLTRQARDGIFRWIRNGVNNTTHIDANGNPIRPNCPGANPTDPCVDYYDIVANGGIGLDPTMMDYINRTPLPNNFTATGDGLNTAGFSFVSPQRERQYDFVTKIDYNHSDAHRFYFRYSKGEQNTFGDAANSGRPRFPGIESYSVNTFRNPENFAFNWRWSPTATFTNEFVTGLNRFGFSFDGGTPDPNYFFVWALATDVNSNFTYNARKARTWQFVDNMTFDLSPHVIKAGLNFRLQNQVDDRSGVAGGSIEGSMGIGQSDFSGFANMPSGSAINSADLARLRNVINDLLGRVGTASQAFVRDAANPNQWLPAQSRWIYDADYPQYDFYIQDNWRMARNFSVDLGVRWEIKLTPQSNSLPLVRPDKDVTWGSAPANDLRWVEGDLLKSDFGVVLPSVGFAWDPFGTGKTSLRANYRMASDYFGTQMFASAIFQNAPGNAHLESFNFGALGTLYRDLGGFPNLTPTTTPDVLSRPPAFGTGSINTIDPDLKFPRVHNWTVSFQRELFGGNVLEVNYVGKKGTHLHGGYNSNQVDIHNSISGVGGSFLEEFIQLRSNSSYNSPLINMLLTGSAANNGGTQSFRSSIATTALSQGSVATAALALSQRVCSTYDINTSGICTAGQAGQRLIGLRGFDNFFQNYSQFTGGMFVVDSNDYSFYNGLEISLKRRIKNGLGFQASYTYSLSKDTRSFDPVFTTVATGISQTSSNTPLDNDDRRANYSWSDFDRPHAFLSTLTYELPFGQGRMFNMPKAVDFFFGGWQIASLIRLTSGRPMSVFSGLYTVSQSTGSYANCDGCPRNLGSLTQDDHNGQGLRNWWFDTSVRDRFTQPGPGETGNTTRNYFMGPMLFDFDASILKKFRINERFSFDLRLDAQNVLNRPSFAFPTTALPANGNIASSLFGRINADVSVGSRTMQVYGKLYF